MPGQPLVGLIDAGLHLSGFRATKDAGLLNEIVEQAVTLTQSAPDAEPILMPAIIGNAGA